MEAGAHPLPRGASAAKPVERAVVAVLVRDYLIASTAFFFVAGLLGMAMRQSQAGVVRLDSNLFYAIMTAHGLGAFVAWAGFAVMGLGLWVLAECDFPMRPVGLAFARATFWLMVGGTLAIVVSTLGLGFAASWVFLYPLPFHAAEQWSDNATAVFAVGVLCAGLAIITWGLAILHTVVGPGNSGVRPGVLNRLGVALGFGYIWPERFPMDERKLPYAVLPLTAIAIDMIIATLPLAGLLVEIVIQAYAPSVDVDPLLAKNILWFFGHPVVYLLLFPAVSIYYLLIPRYAGRPLVAGKLISLAWLLAVIVNVIIWAHHIYLDYPEASLQSTINTAMQPLTFSITLVSALTPLQPRGDDVPVELPVDAGVALPDRRALRLADGRPLRRGQRDDLARCRGPQHAVDRRALPPDGAAEHRRRDLRRGLRVRAAASPATSGTPSAWATCTSR